MIRRLWRLWPSPGLLVRLWLLTAVLAVLQGLLLGLLVPVLRALLRPEPDFGAATGWLVLGSAGLLAYCLLSALVAPVGFAASMELAVQLRRRLMGHVTTLPLGWFTADRKSHFVRTVTNITGELAQLTFVIIAPAITGLLVPITVVSVIAVVDWRLAIPLLVCLPAGLLVLRQTRRTVAEVSAAMEVGGNAVAGRALEFGRAQPVLRAAGLAATGGVRLREALDLHRLRYRRGLRRMLVPELAFSAVVATAYVATVLLGTGFLLDGTLPAADAVALLVLAVRFVEPFGGLGGHASGLGAMEYLVTCVEDVLRTRALPAAPHPVRAVPHAGIEFTAVSFSYGATRALADVSLRCEPGTTTALVGASGSGKTTVTRLVARFFDVDSGSVAVGGVDVRDYDHTALTAQIAIVFQDVYLFDTTIEENIRLARPDASQAEVLAAARAAQLDEVIDRLPAGWRTQVGEGGAQLSGGERQRVSIARAFLKNARIVLIDEAASALDPENEAAVSRAIATLGDDPARTVVVIAHSPATLRAADQIITLDGGRVAECGPPAELLRTEGIFARLSRQHEHTRSWRISARTDPARHQAAGDAGPSVETSVSP
ncbi:ABC transporter ATP-binding protein [Parafrankia sp. FMc2]|uniref:ABC transporter ATP-binding protein n=1 Tax=Parafrankia sp. FMc2 TaxID=3233196 RepID=UPI0034D5E5F0